MLEKDMENLIAQYPEEFFPRSHFTLKGQQISLGKCYADIVFEDKYDRKVIVEIKRGILGRNAIGQIIEYYGLIKQEMPAQFVELILCANTIPNERRAFLENSGIDCKEIKENRFLEIAKKYSYTFIDEKKHLSEKDQSRENILNHKKDELHIKKHKYFTAEGLGQERGKRSKLFNRVKKIVYDLKVNETIVRTINDLIGEPFVAIGLARKIVHDLEKDFNIKVKIKEIGLREFSGSRGKISSRPTGYEITKL